MARPLLVLGALAGLLLIGAAPAGADVPVGWPVPPSVDLLHTILVLALIPLVLGLVLVVLTYGPAIARGERVKPGETPVANQWIGGPRKGTEALPGPGQGSTQDEAGGTSVRW